MEDGGCSLLFSVTYYLKLSNAQIVYLQLHYTNKGRIGCLDIVEH